MTSPRFIHRALLPALLVLAGLTVGSMAACTSTPSSESTGEYLDDTVISSKVRAAILGDQGLTIFKIDVETYKGVVQLSGFVDSAASRQRAGAVAADVTGVRQVRNDLVIK
ncbi:BON domain-containing protein [Rhodospira trueperi]|uniref:BON domain-containing protein n=1 Tax=Rhodospira trueperi TaxID=69960 RepID=A0A1G7HQV3_9PROT|nr:BON domain-containing protein [Rhodospira trueperi]SDF02409.1 BON domain-containing protein [Rhodospira trueperi]